VQANDIPQSPRFTVTVNDRIAVIAPSVETFMYREAQEFDHLFEQLRGKGFTHFIIELGTCDYISSEGLGAIASCWKWCHDEGMGRLSVILQQNTDNEVSNLFEITGLTRIIGSAIQPTLKDALKYIREFA